jgi:hypothetical protein
MQFEEENKTVKSMKKQPKTMRRAAEFTFGDSDASAWRPSAKASPS